MTLALVLALVVCVALLIALVVLVVVTSRRAATAEAQIAQLEADLDAALRPRPAVTPTGRAVRRVVRTVDRVRTHGVAGLLQSSLDDLHTWAADERADVVSMAAADGTVTLFFSDIEDSTSINHRIGDAAWVRVLAAYDQLVRGQVERYRGQVVKTAGDGFMVAFRDAEAACRAALGIQLGITRDLRRSLDPRLRVAAPLKVRIGVHSGPVVSRDGDYFGRNVAMAARVADVAEGGEVLASSAVHEALDDDAAVLLKEAGEWELKGLPGSHVVWRVLRKP